MVTLTRFTDIAESISTIYLDEKYNFSETDLPASYVGEKLPLYVEYFVRELFAKVYGLRVKDPP